MKIFNYLQYINKMKILNVAEKNDAAKNIAAILSKGTSRKREGLSVYNKIYEFNAEVFNQNATMVMTSVSGHLLTYEFTRMYRNWQSCNPLELFEAPVIKTCPGDYVKIKQTLEREVTSCASLIIWTDCDREGENIGFEIIEVCQAVKPTIQVYRARFSEITRTSIFRALQNLERPNKKVSDAVNVRQEIDLRIGAAFTRLQTLHLKQVFPQKLSDCLISYGSCQFPTLGFVVDRYKAIEEFVEQTFWRIKMSHTIDELTVDFSWARDRLFDKNLVKACLAKCYENPIATVKKIESKPKSKWRPLPLDTIEMEKSSSRKLKLNAKTTMQIAERLYSKGFISYPRTETNIFPKELNLTPLVQQQTADDNWGNFARGLLEHGPTPRQGTKSDQAHPPIHPIKYTNELNGDEKRVYEFIVRHFLACCSKDAKGIETVVDVEIAGEGFQAKGLMILEKNYLEVYPYEKWNAKEIHRYEENQQFQPTVLEMAEGHTSPPSLLTEADLIALMDKHGIGTDATHAEHIETVKSREYVAVPNGVHFVPGLLGVGLVEGYDRVGLEISLAKPNLRAELENDLKLICDGVKQPEVVLREQLSKYKAAYKKVLEKLRAIDEAVATRIHEEPVQNVQTFQAVPENLQSPFNCPKCGHKMVLRNKKNKDEKYLSCSYFPQCNNAIWFPSEVKNVTVTDDTCPVCGPNYRKLKIEFHRMFYGCYTSPLITCIGGCDIDVLSTFGINEDRVKKKPSSNSNSNANTITNNNTNSINNSNAINFNSSSQTRNRVQNPVNSNSQPRNRIGNVTNLNSNAQNRNRIESSQTNQRNVVNSVQNPDSARVPNRTFQTNRNVPGPAGDSQNEIVCGCSQPALLLTVRKEGPNTGRQFYKCAKNECDFFLWFSNNENEPSASGSPNTFNNPTDFNRRNIGGAALVNCDCGEPAVKRTVQKDTPNKGRSFYCCAKPANVKCNFFKWADEADGSDDRNQRPSQPSTSNNFWSNSNFGSNNSKKTKRSDNSTTNETKRKRNNSTQRRKRKCGNCREEGHIRTKCPHRQ